MLDRPPGQPSTAPYQPPSNQRCARCDDEPVAWPGAAAGVLCIEAAHRAIRSKPGQVVGPRDIEAARRVADV